MKRTAAALILAVGMAGCGQRPIESIRHSGDRYFDRDDYTAAAKEYDEIIQRYPGDWRAQYQLGRCKLALNRPTEAHSALEIAYTNNPRSADVVDALAEAMFRQGEQAQLYDFLKQRAESDQTVRSWLRLARYSSELGDADSAQTAYETAIMLDEGRSTEPYIQAAAFAEAIGDMDEALRRLRQAYGINPGDVRVTQRLRDLGEVPGPTIALPPGA